MVNKINLKSKYIYLIFLTHCYCSVIFSQQTLPSFSLKDAFKILETNNLSLQQLEKTINQSHLEMKIKKTGYLPTISSTASFNYVSELAQLEIPFQLPGITIPTIEAGVKDQYDLALILKQPLFTGFRKKNLVNASEKQHLANQIQKRVLKNKLFFQVGQIVHNIQLNLLQQKVLEQSIDRANFQLQKVKNLLEAKQITAFDTLEIANRKLHVSNQLIKLKNVKKVLRSKLLFLLNTDELAEIELPDFMEQNLILNDLQFYSNQAVAQRPELKQFVELKDAQAFQVKAIQSAYFPQIYANATYHYARPGVNFFKDEWMDYYTFGVNLQWEMWNWNRTKQKSQQTKLSIQQLDLKIQEIRQKIEQEVTEVYQYLLTTREQIELQQKLVQQEKSRYQITNEKYEQGLATTLDLSDSEKKLTEAEFNLQKSYVEWKQYKLQLDYVAGIIGIN